MKQSIFKFCFAAVVAMFSVGNAFAQDTPPNDEIWYTSTDGQVVTPPVVESLNAQILTNIYNNGKGIIKFDKNLTTIGDYAFSLCSTLSSISIPNSVTILGPSSFKKCTSLNNINLSDELLNIEMEAFRGCTNLISIKLPISLKSIGTYAFCECSSLISVSVGNQIINMSSNVFDLAPVKELTFVEGTTKLWCTHLTSIEKVNIPKSVKVIGSNTFYNCNKLATISIPDSVITIGESAFYGCSSLTTITLPNSVTSIGESAFSGCTNLQNATIHIMDFSNNNIIFDYISTWKNVLYYYDGKEIVGTFSIPDSTKSLGKSVLRKCYKLNSISIPNSVTSIANNAFRMCNSLTTITIPNSIKSIGANVFSGCTNLQNATIHVVDFSNNNIIFDYISTLNNVSYIYNEQEIAETFSIPDSTKTLGKSALRGCDELTSITIPNSVTSIGSYTFKNCTNLATITNLSTQPQAINSNCFSSYTATLYVPYESIDLYKATDVWKDFANIKTIIPTEIQNLDTSEIKPRELYLSIYNLRGQHILTPKKGEIYIQGGKKVKF